MVTEFFSAEASSSGRVEGYRCTWQPKVCFDQDTARWKFL